MSFAPNSADLEGQDSFCGKTKKFFVKLGYTALPIIIISFASS
jgi:hypothetical protein